MQSHRKILITGATGGLGLALVEAFAKNGYQVTATGRNTLHAERLKSYGATFHPMDLMQDGAAEELCKGQDSIIHAAALSSSWGHPDLFEKANIEATRILLNAAKKACCQRFVYISSPSVYASLKDSFALTEQDLPVAIPLNDYARTKLVAEKMVLDADTDYFRTTAIRPRAIIGPDDRVLLPKMLEILQQGIMPVFRNGKALVELTDVRDVAQAILLAEEKIDKVSGNPINISGGAPVLISELAEKLAQATGYSVRYIPIPMPVAKWLARIGEWRGKRSNYSKEPKLTRYTLSTMAYSKTFNLNYAREQLGYHPQYDAFASLLEIAGRERKQ